MEGRKSKSRRKSAFSHAARRPALEEEDWETKRERLIGEHFMKESAGDDIKSATPEVIREHEEAWERRVRTQESHEANPVAAVQRWSDLWRARVPRGDNRELREVCELFEYYSASAQNFHPDDLEEEGTGGCNSRHWKALYEAGLSMVCIEIAQDEDLFNEKREIVLDIVTIAYNTIAWGGYVLPVDFDDWSSIPRTLQLAREMCLNVWDHRDLLLGGGSEYGDQNPLRLGIAELLCQVYRLPDSRGFLDDPPDVDLEERGRLRSEVLQAKNDSLFRRMTFFCWMNGTPPNDLNRAFFGRDVFDIPPGLSDSLLREVTYAFEYNPDVPSSVAIIESLTAFVRDEILGVYGAPRFFERLQHSLRESPLERHLMLLLVDLRQLGTHPLLQPHLLSTGTYLAIRDAVERDALLSRSEYNRFTVLGEALRIYRTGFTMGPPAEVVHLVRECNIIEFIAQYVRMYAVLGHDEVTQEMYWGSGLFEPVDVVNMYAAFAAVVNLRSGKNTLRRAMRHSLRQEWYATLQVLRTERRESAHWQGMHRTRIDVLERAWFALGEGVSLNEEAERRDYEREAKKNEQLCSWRACRYHVEKPPTSVMICRGCGQVRYCSRECQKLDWKEGKHKVKCGDRLTAA